MIPMSQLYMMAWSRRRRAGWASPGPPCYVSRGNPHIALQCIPQKYIGTYVDRQHNGRWSVHMTHPPYRKMRPVLKLQQHQISTTGPVPPLRLGTAGLLLAVAEFIHIPQHNTSSKIQLFEPASILLEFHSNQIFAIIKDMLTGHLILTPSP